MYLKYEFGKTVVLSLTLFLFSGHSVAADYFVTSLQEMHAAVESAEMNMDPDTIHIQNDFFLNESFQLPSITTEIHVNGNNHTLSRASGDTDAFRLLHAWRGAVVEINNLTVSGANQSAIFVSQLAGFPRPDLTLNNVVLFENQSSPSTPPTGNGGAIRMSGGKVTINNSQIDNNHAGNGGGIYNSQGEIFLNNSEISNNVAEESGGGVYITNPGGPEGSIDLNSSQITGNRAANGGGIRLGGSFPDFLTALGGPAEASVISNNHAEIDGGGVYAISSAFVNLGYIAITGNTAGNFGGGVYNSSQGLFDFEAATISGNRAGVRGGGYHARFSEENRISNTTISRNHANEGAGFMVEGSILRISNSTISSNIASSTGGGIYGDTLSNPASFITLTDSTIAFNRGAIANRGSGIELIDSNNTDSIVLTNSIISDSSGGLDCNNHPGFTADTFNMIENAGCSTAAVITGARLGELQDNGGPTLTHAPKTGSYAIGNGDPSRCVAEDQRFFPRSPTACFVGAVEGIHVDQTTLFVIPGADGKTFVVPL